MSDRMSDMDALVDVAANGVIETREYVAGVAFGVPDDARGVYVKAIARAALLAVGLPALLERVEAAEAEHGALLEAHTELLGQFAKVYDQRDALAAKVARVEALIEFAESELAKGYFITGRVATDDLRAALAASETP